MLLFHSPGPQSEGPDARTRIHVWLALTELAMDEAGFLEGKRRLWKTALAAFLADCRNPGRVLRSEVREYLYRKTELGAGGAPARSLPVAQAALAFFYEKVLPRPALAEIARDPFPPAPPEAHPDWRIADWSPCPA